MARTNGDGAWETKDIPASVRKEVRERDGSICRCCGRWSDQLCLHHIEFRSQGGLHVPGNLISLGWTPGDDCHLTKAHGPNAREWRELFLAVIEQPGVTAFQLRRWSRRREGN